MTPTYDDLVDEVKVLRTRLSDLTKTDEALKLTVALGLTPKQSQLLALLYQHDGPVSMDKIYGAVFQHDDGDGPEPKIIDVCICRIRAKVRGCGWPGQIITVRRARSLSPDLRAHIASILAPQAIAA